MAIILRSDKGSPLTHGEMDSNWTDSSNKLRIDVRNESGSTLAVGTIVKATGYNLGQDKVTVTPTVTSSDVAFGIVDEELANNTNGTVVNTGVVEDVDTSAWSVGDKLYSNGSGSFTSIIPTAPFQTCAFVLRSNINNGRLYVEFTNPDGLSYDASGNVTIDGNCTANAFYGDGSNLTGIGADLVNDTTPQLGGDLDLNGRNITGTGNINTTGTLTNTGDASINGVKIGLGNLQNSNLTALGLNALNSVAFGGGCVAVGDNTLKTGTFLTSCTAVGSQALESCNALNNTAVGASAGRVLTSSAENTLIGANAGYDITSGDRNSLVGAYAGYNISTGGWNNALGERALYTATTATRNVAIGNNSMYYTTTGSNNVAIGYYASQDLTTGNYNTALGVYAGADITTGNENVAIGYQALYKSSTGQYSTCVGSKAGYASTATGSPVNTFIGAWSGYNNTTGAQNTFLGGLAGYNVTTGLNNTNIGYYSQSSSATVSNEFTLGNNSVNNLRCNDTTISSLSDERDKTNIQDIPLGLDFINQMRPVSFDWDRRDGSFEGRKDFGFIAQELLEIQNDTEYAEHLRLVHEDNPDKLEADPMKTYPVLVKAVQELSAKIEELEAKIALLEGGA